MLDVRRIRVRTGLPICVVMALLLSPEPALAHKMYLFARFQAETIRGQVYFRGGTPAEGVTVEAFDPAGQNVGQTRTDEQGEFTLPVRSQGELKLMATTDDGHAAEPFTLKTAEPAEESPVVEPGPDENQPGPSTSETPQSSPHRSDAAPDRERLEAAIEAAVSRQLSPLRKQITELQREVRGQIDQFKVQMQDQITFRDYVGGIGYIMGLMGLAFYILGVRRRSWRAAGSEAGSQRAPSGRPAEPGRPERPGG